MYTGKEKGSRHRVNEEYDAQEKIESIEKEILDHRNERDDVATAIEDLENGLDHWKTEWRKNVETIGLDAEASPTAAMAVIDAIYASARCGREVQVGDSVVSKWGKADIAEDISAERRSGSGKRTFVRR